MMQSVRFAVALAIAGAVFGSSAHAGWSQSHKLTPDDGAPGDGLGHSVALIGNAALVGSSSDDDNGDQSGSAYLFNATTGAQIAKLTPDDGAASDYFGSSVALSGNAALVGSYQDDDNGKDSGSAYLFNATTGARIAKLTPDDVGSYEQFGYSVALSENTALVGSRYGNDSGIRSGSAYLFVPEPASIALLGLGALALTRRRG